MLERLFVDSPVLVPPSVTVPPVPSEKTKIKTQSEISATDRQKLVNYLEAIGEDDQALIDEYFAECVKSPDLLAGQLQHAETVLRRLSN